MIKLTILQTGKVPDALAGRFASYPDMFRTMFERVGARYDYEVVPVVDGAPLPQPGTQQGVLITGSAAGVYDDFAWLDPLRDFIARSYGAGTPMVGICFGHQIIADALGGDVRKSEKGWGLGRHTYDVAHRPAHMSTAPQALSVACSHQDQVIVPPPSARVVMGSTFTPNAGLAYDNGRAISFQPHPEFADDYARALIDLRRGKAPDAVIDAAHASIAKESHSRDLAGYIAAFLERAKA